MATRTTKERNEANRLINVHYTRAPNFLEPPAWNAVLWRYMDLPKFVSMLASKKLPLIRVDKFDDKWEGFSAPLSENEYQGFFAKENRQTDFDRFMYGKNLRKCYYANCWHLSDIESDAMWKLYSIKEGLAIRTTYQSLIYSLRNAKLPFLIGKVLYKKSSAGISMLRTCMTKRESFEHEKEVRVIWRDTDAEEAYRKNPGSKMNQPPVALIPCDCRQLIEKVFISPKAKAWFAPAVSDLLKKYKLKDVEINPSFLSGEPQWPK